MVNCTCT